MAQDQQEYIQQKVNPILEGLVTQLLVERPEQLAPFMIKWLSEQTKTPAAAALTSGVSVLGELRADLEKLQEEVKQLEAELGGEGEKEKDEEDEEEDDEEDIIDDAPPPAHLMNRGPRASVSAEAYGAWNKEVTDFVAPVHPKSDERKNRLREILQDSFLFRSLEKNDLEVVIMAMQEKEIEQGVRLINQGDDGQHLYVVEDGQMDCFKKMPDGSEKKVKECQKGDAFGELALLYNCPRAASVIAQTRCTVMELDRETFNHIVKKAATMRRNRYEEFLKAVPILRTLEVYERSTLCDVVSSKEVAQGTVIVKQGDAGDLFYILEEGECKAEKVYPGETAAKQVMSYKSGDYFGELALLSNEPRAATVTATSDCKILHISGKNFKTLLGPLEEIMRKAIAEKYI